MEQWDQHVELEFYFVEGRGMPGVNNSILKALDILDLLGRAPEQLRLMDIALQLDLPESTTHRLLASMAEKGYVQQREHNGPYVLGWKIVTLARSLGTGQRLVQDLRPYLEQVLRDVKQTVNLGVLNDLQVTYLDCLTPNNAVALYTPPGLLVPAYATSLGKALLAYLPEPELEAALSRLQLEPLTPRSITSRSRLQAALAEVRQQGYAVDHGEFHRDVSCVAAPILEPDGRAIAAISVTARATEVAPNWEEQTAAPVLRAAREAARTLFGVAHQPQGGQHVDGPPAWVGGRERA
jgi:DNA-binding IclR family transcriptional regulator